MNGIPKYTRVKRVSTLVYSSTASMLMAARALLSSPWFSFHFSTDFILSLLFVSVVNPSSLK